MSSVYIGDDFQSLKDHIEQLKKRGEDEASDRLRRHLAKLEAMKAQRQLVEKQGK